MESVSDSLPQWETTRETSAPFGLPFERSLSTISVFGAMTRQSSNIFGCFSEQPCTLGPRFTRLASLDDLGAMLNTGEDYSFQHQVSAAVSLSQKELGDETLDADTMDSSFEAVTSPTEKCVVVGRRRTRTDSNSSQFDELDESRPWESENAADLNTVPAGFVVPDPPNFAIALGDLRVIGRFHVQKEANTLGIRLPAGMTNYDLNELSFRLGLYPLMYRLHLEVSGKVEPSPLHALFLEYKRESKIRAKKNKVVKDSSLKEKTRRLSNGEITIDYFEGIALRLGRERDTIFRPLLHRVFQEFKADVKQSLVKAGLNYNEMRKWRDTQLCTALFVADRFQTGIWNTAVQVHLLKTKR